MEDKEELLIHNLEQGISLYCNLWNGTFTPLYHSANVIITAAFLVPQGIPTSLLALRSLLLLGIILLTIWSSVTICRAPDLFLWNCLFTLINCVYVIILAKKHFPVFIGKDLMGLYNKLFSPLHISKKVG